MASRILLAPGNNPEHREKERFKKRLISLCERWNMYEDPRIIDKARGLVPWQQMTIDAKSKAVEDGHPPNNLEFWDYLMRELARWFKFDFFSWTNNPPCPACGGTTAPTGPVQPLPEEIRYGANRVEGFICSTCRRSVRFPRYNHVEKLLDTRSGRCGEWANCFTFFCHVLGFQARSVRDWYGDHVWTEYWSPKMSRWVHVDACENAIDTPLMYEVGWNKRMTYNIALARDHVSDVTMRYSTDLQGVLRRRTDTYRHPWLYDALYEVNSHLMAELTPKQKVELNMRMLRDYTDMMVDRKPGQGSTNSRTSGSADWIASRGEGSQSGAEFVFKPSNAELAVGRLHVRYSCCADAYERVVDETRVKGWRNGTAKFSGVFRKEEHDWKMVYLCRAEGNNAGSISWKFELKDQDDNVIPINRVRVRCEKATFQTGHVEGTISNGKKSAELVTLPAEESRMVEYPNVTGENVLTIECVMMRGSGDYAWQHAQLFRESLTPADQKWPFEVILEFDAKPIKPAPE